MKKINQNSPDAETVKTARLSAGLTQKAAAELIEVGTETWRSWERQHNRMPPSYWKLFLLLTDPELDPCLKKWKR